MLINPCSLSPSSVEIITTSLFSNVNQTLQKKNKTKNHLIEVRVKWSDENWVYIMTGCVATFSNFSS